MAEKVVLLSEEMRSWEIMEFYNIRKVSNKWADKAEKLEQALRDKDKQIKEIQKELEQLRVEGARPDDLLYKGH